MPMTSMRRVLNIVHVLIIAKNLETVVQMWKILTGIKTVQSITIVSLVIPVPNLRSKHMKIAQENTAGVNGKKKVITTTIASRLEKNVQNHPLQKDLKVDHAKINVDFLMWFQERR